MAAGKVKGIFASPGHCLSETNISCVVVVTRPPLCRALGQYLIRG